MARRTAELSTDEIKLGIDRLTNALNNLRAFDPQAVTDQRNVPDIPRLRAAIDEALVRTFGADTADYHRYRRATDLARRLLTGPLMPIADVRREFDRVKTRSVGLLEQAIAGLKVSHADRDVTGEPPQPAQQAQAELVSLKPSFWGISLDLKEAWRRSRRRWHSRKK